MLPTELNAQSTLQIELDPILSAVLTVHLAQLATTVTVSTNTCTMQSPTGKLPTGIRETQETDQVS